MNVPRPTWRTWLLTDTPVSRRQAALGLAYRRWRRFSGNPLSVFGLSILVVLVIVRGIFLKGLGLELLWPQAAAMTAWGVVVLALAVARSSKRSA